MIKHYIITDKSGKQIQEGELSEAEVRMVAKAGYRVFNSENNELTAKLTGLFEDN